MPTPPRASIVIATYNRAERLAACLAALANQAQPAGDFEVVVVVDGSADGTSALLAEVSTPYRLVTLFQENQGQCAALNRGAAAASGALLIFVDDDILAFPGLVRSHLALFEAAPDAVGIGQMLLETPPGSDWFARAFAEGWRSHYQRLNKAPDSVTWRDCFGGNMSVSRERFLRLGGFITGLARGYDVELAARLAACGSRFAYLPEAIGLQDERKDARSLLRDAEQGGRGAVAIYRRHPEALSLIGHFPDHILPSMIALAALIRLGAPPELLARLLWWVPVTGNPQPWFDLLHRYAYWRGVKDALDDEAAWAGLSRGVVILMYHAFCGPGERPSRYLIAPARFVSQMRWLQRLGYRVTSLESYVRMRRAKALPSSKMVIITIDDGYAETLTRAAPALHDLDLPATVFLPTARMGGVNDWDAGSELYGRALLSWDGARRLPDLAIDVQSHGRTHRPLTELEPQEFADETFGAQADFEREFGRPARFISYPYGELRPDQEELVAQVGYEAGLTVDPGPNALSTGLYSLRRVEIRGTDSLLAFVYALHTGREFRAGVRRIRHLLSRVGRRLAGRVRSSTAPGRAAGAALTEKH